MSAQAEKKRVFDEITRIYQELRDYIKNNPEEYQRSQLINSPIVQAKLGLCSQYYYKRKRYKLKVRGYDFITLAIRYANRIHERYTARLTSAERQKLILAMIADGQRGERKIRPSWLHRAYHPLERIKARAGR